VSSASQCSVRNTHAAFPFCTAKLKRCQRNDIDRESLVTASIRRPSSCKKRVASSPTAPCVSMAIGMNWNSFDSAAYLSIFSCSAWWATYCPGPVRLCTFRWLAVSVSGLSRVVFEVKSSEGKTLNMSKMSTACPWTCVNEIYLTFVWVTAAFTANSNLWFIHSNRSCLFNLSPKSVSTQCTRTLVGCWHHQYRNQLNKISKFCQTNPFHSKPVEEYQQLRHRLFQTQAHTAKTPQSYVVLEC